MMQQLSLFKEFRSPEENFELGQVLPVEGGSDTDSTVTLMLQLACYQGLPSEVVSELEEYVEEGKRIVSKANFDLAEIFCQGRRKYRHNKHGGFERWIEERFGITRQTAYRVISRYEKLGDVEDIDQLDIGLTAQYTVTAASVPQAAVTTTLTEARAGQKISLESAKKIVQLEKNIASAEQDLLSKDQALRELEQEIEELRLEKTQYIERDSAQTLQRLEQLEKEQEDLQDLRDQAERDFQAQLQKKEDTLTQMRKENAQKEKDLEELRKMNKKIAKENRDLTEEAKLRFIEGQATTDHLRVRQAWRKTADKFIETIAALATKFPTFIDREAFESDDWARHAQCVEILIRCLDILQGMHKGQQQSFVDSQVVEQEMAYVSQ